MCRFVDKTRNESVSQGKAKQRGLLSSLTRAPWVDTLQNLTPDHQAWFRSSCCSEAVGWLAAGSTKFHTREFHNELFKQAVRFKLWEEIGRASCRERVCQYV